MEEDRINFNARMLNTWTPDRLYRVYLMRDELFFIRIGGQRLMSDAVAVQFGLLGAAIAKATGKRTENKMAAKLAELDQIPPSLLLSRHKHNFRALRSEVVETNLNPPSTFASHGEHYGRWKITLRNQKPMTLQLEQLADMQTALQALPHFFGPLLDVTVRFDLSKQRYVKK